MSQMDFFVEGIQQLPAIVDKGPTAQEKVAQAFMEFMQLAHVYESAIEVVKTYLGILDSEFNIKFQRNPIHNIESRLKSADSIMNKLVKKGIAFTPENAKKYLLDIAGIRVTCCYINDIYVLAEMLSQRDDFVVIKQKDYIKNPKPSGYRSFHLVLNVPVHLSSSKVTVPVEIQIRTIAMDFWASLEHQLKYKPSAAITPEISEQLRECAERIAETDMQMQAIYTQINDMD
ncbi:MAG: GTP pyrophosphokinase family protein [Ruminococcus sp.]|nr:GTP pyrophosphokinase family protein [Ruminococcus sp.]